MQLCANQDSLTLEAFYHSMELGKPFCVSGVAKDWQASQKWSEDYFRSVFSEFELFSSTFATNSSPVFESVHREDVYYGIFLNDRGLASFLAADYSYPKFIPQELAMQGGGAIINIC